MARLTIERDPSTDEGTFGVATYGSTSWHSLELPWRDNAPNVSCIPPGVYKAIAEHSPRFGRMIYRLQAVPGRTDVELHPANFGGDRAKGYYSDLEGCLCLGESTGQLARPDGQGDQPAVERSGAALDGLFALTGGAEIEISIIWTAGAEPPTLAQDAPAPDTA
jgi:hypothetical protein